MEFFANAALTRAVLGRGLGAKYDPTQKRDRAGRWSDGVDIESLILKPTGHDENGDLEFEAYELDEDVTARAREMLALDFGGLSTANIKFEPSFEEHTPGTWIQGDIVDESGVQVGNFVRRVYDDDGRLKVEHTNLKLDEHLQGQGFAQAFNQQLFDWYRASGVREVHLTANIDVGGYAWARAGYDWADRMAAEGIRDELSRAASVGDARIPVERLAEQRRLAAEMEERFSGRFGDDDYPTPFEVSQLGRWPGAGKDDWWIGKAAMVGSEWEAVTRP